MKSNILKLLTLGAVLAMPSVALPASSFLTASNSTLGFSVQCGLGYNSGVVIPTTCTSPG